MTKNFGGGQVKALQHNGLPSGALLPAQAAAKTPGQVLLASPLWSPAAAPFVDGLLRLADVR